ncbi:major facilitator superfamily domain-containing protein [Pseudoneurospora amorphoporcata]|uniref:Major facilitator superfamily domain-containing protein n=1 Tax=Pseudoneurospora amorphoporcata TaxID=241081 RepID=A0AAN6NMQ1_9PEZI|nr:major facilitator superfamily domain-containing protein [Pseudoneurospora amorphoporcata]
MNIINEQDITDEIVMGDPGSTTPTSTPLEKKTPLETTTPVSANSSQTALDSGAEDQAAGEPTTLVVAFAENDPENPHNWSPTKKLFIVVATTLACINSGFGSALCSNLSPLLVPVFNFASPGPQTTLPTSMYLIGFVFGPLICAPLSETYGRRPVLVIGFGLFVLATLGCALANSWPLFLVMRLLAGTFGAPPNSVGGGVVADVFGDKVMRGRMMMIWSASSFVGPLGAPVVGGFLGRSKGWRWVFWCALIVAGVSFIAVALLPETFHPKLLKARAEKLNKQMEAEGKAKGVRYVAPVTGLGDADGEKLSVWRQLSITLCRPMVLLCTELLLGLTCIYLAFVYTVFYMMLRIGGTIWTGTYNFTPGIAGVAFMIMGLGTIIACFVVVWYDSYGPKLAARYPADRKSEYLRLPVACVGGPIFVISLLWLGWTSRQSVHWAVPLVAYVPYGFAYHMIFTAMINYVADAYSPLNFAASALAACGTTRSIAGALIPLAIDNMLAALGVAWAITVLAIVSAVLCLVPFAFIIYAEAIRTRSPCSRLGGLTAEDLGSESDGEEVEEEGNEEDLEKGTGAALKRERTQKSQRTVRSHRSRISRRSGMSRASRRSILEMSGANEVGMGELTRSLSAV